MVMMMPGLPLTECVPSFLLLCVLWLRPRVTLCVCLVWGRGVGARAGVTYYCCACVPHVPYLTCLYYWEFFVLCRCNLAPWGSAPGFVSAC